MRTAKMHDGTVIDVEVNGTGPSVLLAVNPRPTEGPAADEIRKWGADPALGRRLVDGLKENFRVVAFDYEGHVLSAPKPETLTPENVAADLLAVADAAGADRFAYYGYSWLALTGLQLALRTDRLSALVMGGYPPIDGPYAEMLRVTQVAHELSLASRREPAAPQATDQPDWSTVEVTTTPAQTRQFVTLYEALREFDDRAAQSRISCPRLCFAGSADEIEYGPRWGDVRVRIAEPLLRRRTELAALGWDVRVLEGLDHLQAMQAANVLPVLRPWLLSTVAS